ncbi:MAG TPA: type 1 glutamine amidotransferase domain-containing protein [Polyangiaceae bacterium]
MEKILAIATNAAPLLHGKPTGLWLSELTHFLDVIEGSGFGYDLASPLGGKIPIDERRKSLEAQVRSDPVNARYMNSAGFLEKLGASLRAADVDPRDYAALYLSGGHGTMFDFRQSAPLQRLIGELYSEGRYLSGVCHGVSGFIDSTDSAGRRIVAGKTVTGFSNFEDALDGSKKLMPFLLEDELKRSGATYRKNLIPFTERVEVDGRLVTGQNPQSAHGVGKALVAALAARTAGAV